MQNFNIVTANCDTTVLRRQRGGEADTLERLEFGLVEGVNADEIDQNLVCFEMPTSSRPTIQGVPPPSRSRITQLFSPTASPWFCQVAAFLRMFVVIFAVKLRV